uniref:Uncharacterized protein n=1 Tax=Paracentrotus lividus TaxID=7656 RepID=E9L082_PARLI|nr:unknown protein [Paracentrotus lividus]
MKYLAIFSLLLCLAVANAQVYKARGLELKEYDEKSMGDNGLEEDKAETAVLRALVELLSDESASRGLELKEYDEKSMGDNGLKEDKAETAVLRALVELLPQVYGRRPNKPSLFGMFGR